MTSRGYHSVVGARIETNNGSSASRYCKGDNNEDGALHQPVGGTSHYNHGRGGTNHSAHPGCCGSRGWAPCGRSNDNAARSAGVGPGPALADDERIQVGREAGRSWKKPAQATRARVGLARRSMTLGLSSQYWNERNSKGGAGAPDARDRTILETSCGELDLGPTHPILD